MDNNKTPFEVYVKLIKNRDYLENLKILHNELFIKTREADNNKIYITDFFIHAVLKRSLDLLDSFLILINNWHYMTAGAILRMQIDNLLRIFYISKRNDSDFLKEFMKGKSFRDLKHTDNNKITDALLVKIAKNKYPWIEDVYKETSKFIHLSSKHYHTNIISMNDEERSEITFFDVGNRNCPEDVLYTILEAFEYSTDAILNIVKGWIISKANISSSS